MATDAAHRYTRLGASGKRAADHVGRSRAARPARSRDGDDRVAELIPAGAHLSRPAAAATARAQARQYRLAVPALLRRQHALPTGRTTQPSAAAACSAAGRLDADAVWK